MGECKKQGAGTVTVDSERCEDQDPGGDAGGGTDAGDGIRGGARIEGQAEGGMCAGVQHGWLKTLLLRLDIPLREVGEGGREKAGVGHVK